MAAQLIDGKALAQQVRDRLAQESAELLAKKGIVPGLATILVGDDPASHVYVKNKQKACEMADELDYKMHQLKCGHIVCIIFFQKDQYIRTTGMIARIDETSRLLQIVNTRISFDDIYDIESDLPNAFCNTPYIPAGSIGLIRYSDIPQSRPF